MKSLTYKPAARSDFSNIYDYTVNRWGRAQAEKYIRTLDETARSLASGLLPGRDASTIRAGYRRERSGSHHLYYLETASEITVVRILHQRQDPGIHLPE